MLEVHMHTGSFLRTLPHRLLTQGPLITAFGVFLMTGGIITGLNSPDHPDFPKYTGFIILGVGAIMTVTGLALCSAGVGLTKSSKSDWSDDESETGTVTTVLKLPPVIETPPGVVPRTFLCQPASKPSMPAATLPSVHSAPSPIFSKDVNKKPSWDDPPPPYSSTYKGSSTNSVNSSPPNVIHQFT